MGKSKKGKKGVKSSDKQSEGNIEASNSKDTLTEGNSNQDQSAKDDESKGKGYFAEGWDAFKENFKEASVIEKGLVAVFLVICFPISFALSKESIKIRQLKKDAMTAEEESRVQSDFLAQLENELSDSSKWKSRKDKSNPTQDNELQNKDALTTSDDVDAYQNKAPASSEEMLEDGSKGQISDVTNTVTGENLSDIDTKHER